MLRGPRAGDGGRGTGAGPQGPEDEGGAGAGAVYQVISGQQADQPVCKNLQTGVHLVTCTRIPRL